MSVICEGVRVNCEGCELCIVRVRTVTMSVKVICKSVICEGDYPHPLPHPILLIISGFLDNGSTHEAGFGDHARVPLHSPFPTLPPHLSTSTLHSYTPHTTLQPVARGGQKSLTPPL